MATSRPGVRTTLLLAVTWLVGATVAIGIGYFAIDLVGNDLTGGTARPISESELHEAADRAGIPSTPSTARTDAQDTPATSAPVVAPPSATPPTVAPPAVTPTTTPKAKPDTAAGRRFTTAGGVASASCAGSTITLLYAYPNDGYTSEISRGPTHIEIEFHSPARSARLDLRCADGVPTATDDDERERQPESR